MRRRFVNDSIVTKNTGVRNSPNNVTPSMPENTATPIALTHLAAGAVRDHQRHHAHDERERRHQDRPQAQPAGFHAPPR